jgi:hypothetical protein
MVVLCPSREIESLNKIFKLAGPLVYYSGSNETSLTPQFKWLEYTFKIIQNIQEFNLSLTEYFINKLSLNVVW